MKRKHLLMKRRRTLVKQTPGVELPISPPGEPMKEQLESRRVRWVGINSGCQGGARLQFSEPRTILHVKGVITVRVKVADVSHSHPLDSF